MYALTQEKIDTPGNVYKCDNCKIAIYRRLRGMKVEKSLKFPEKRVGKSIDFFAEMIYTLTVVCLGMKW